MDLRLSTLRNTRVSANGARSLPSARVQTMVVRQPVNLRPMGNTVALSVPAEMPFMSRNISVQTQASGGMAKADPSQQSKRLRGMFMNGLSGLSGTATDADYAFFLFILNDPDAGNYTRADFDNSAKVSQWVAAVNSGNYSGQLAQFDQMAPADRARYIEGGSAPAAAPVAAAAPAAKAAPATSSWAAAGDIFSTVTKAGTSIYAAAHPTVAPVAVQQRVVAAVKSNMTPILIVGGIAAVGLLAFFLLRKKGSAAPAAA